MSIKDTKIYQKQVRKNPQSSPNEISNLCIVELLRSGKTATQISKDLGIKKNSLSYYLSSLKRNGIIENIGYGVWKILVKDVLKQVRKSSPVIKKTTKDLKNKNFEHVSEDDIRGHAFVIRFKIKKGIKNWDKRLEILKERFKELKPKELNGGVGITFKGRKIHLWNESIVIYETKSYISRLASISKTTALYDLQQLLKSLENKLAFRETFTINNQYKFTVSREHFSMVKNALAKQFDREGNKLQIYNAHGCWMVIDNSYNLHEWEIFKNKEDVAVKDSEALQAYWNDHKKHNFKVTPSFTLEVMNGIQQNQLSFNKNSENLAENLRTHFKVLNSIGSEIKRLGKAISILKNKLK